MCHRPRVIKLDLIISVPLITYWRADLGFESAEVFHKWCLNAGYITFKNSPEKFLLCTWKGECGQPHLAGQRTFSVQWNFAVLVFSANSMFILDPEVVRVLKNELDGTGRGGRFCLWSIKTTRQDINKGIIFIKTLTSQESILWWVAIARQSDIIFFH